MEYSPISGPNTAAAYAAQIGETQLWQKTVERFAENDDFWGTMEGAGDDNIIVTGEDLSAGRGHIMNIRVKAGLYGKPTVGETPFSTDAQFEKRKLGDYQLKISLIRHASSFNELSEEVTGARGEINNGLPEELGAWLGRYRSEQMDMTWLKKANPANFMTVNSKTEATLGAADGLTWNSVSTAKGYLGRLGGTRARVTKGVNPQMRLSLIASTTALTVLRQSADYQAKVINAGVRGMENTIFKGTVTDIDGVAVVEREIIDHDGDGPIGGPQEPRAKLGVAIAAGTTTFDLKGGGNAVSAALTQVDYFRYFDGYAYAFMDGTSATVGAEEKYFLVINPPNAATDPNKIGMYAYTTGNDGHKIAVSKRLGSATAGIRNTLVGDVTWNTGVWAGKHTDVHPVGAIIIACNAKGEPVGRSFLVARAAALRGYGKHKAKRDTETEEGGFFTKTYLRSYFGQRIRENANGEMPGIVVLNHSLHYPDLPLPTVV